MAQPEADVSTTSFYDPAWIEQSGGWIHANNVLFYFARSPFYDRMSVNETVFVQAMGNYHLSELHLATRQKFEAELQNRLGVQYTVEADPLALNARIKSPTGQDEQSEIWVIRKALRENLHQTRDELKALEYYYIANSIIFQAPRLDAILDYHMTNMTMQLKEMFDKFSTLTKFSAADGYSYLSGSKQGPGRQSKTGSPVPEASQEAEVVVDGTGSTERTLAEALKLVMAHGGQFYDDAPLLGEPGSFRYAKGKDQPQVSKALEGVKSTVTAPPSKAGTPAPSQTIKASPAPADNGGPQINGSKDESQRPKPKRRKSVMVNGTS